MIVIIIQKINYSEIALLFHPEENVGFSEIKTT